MKNFLLMFFLISVLSNCSSKRELIYLNDSNDFSQSIIDLTIRDNNINSGDILKIDVHTVVPEASVPYNKISNKTNPSIQLLQIDGYIVDNQNMISFPVLGKIKTKDLSILELENKLTNMLIDGDHLSNPNVKIRRINSKFTVLGEVNNPGTYSYFDEDLNLFQALGYAGDLNIYGKRNDITLIREEKGIRKVFKITLTKSELLEKPLYQIKNNDVIIVHPSFSRVKSAGFIGSPASISSIASLLLSITLLIINK